MSDIRDLATFRRFIALLVSRCGQMLNKTDLAAPLGVSVPTITAQSVTMASAAAAARPRATPANPPPGAQVDAVQPLLVKHSAEGCPEGYQNDIVLVGAGEVRSSSVEHADDLEGNLPDEDPAARGEFFPISVEPAHCSADVQDLEDAGRDAQDRG